MREVGAEAIDLWLEAVVVAVAVVEVVRVEAAVRREGWKKPHRLLAEEEGSRPGA